MVVLVIAMLVATLAAAILARQSRALRYSNNFASVERAWQYVYTLEQFAGIQLQRDLKTNQYDALTDRWAYRVPAQTVTEDSGAKVTFSGRLEDLQARFNLNNLLDEQGKLRTTGEDVYLRQLVKVAGLPPGFSSVIVDWMDRDVMIQNGDSAERDYYLAGTIPYHTADMPFTDSSELRLLRLDALEDSAREKALNRFQQMVTTLPTSLLAKPTLNVNTASQDVLEAFGLSRERVATVMAARQQKRPYKTQDEFINALSLNAQDPADQALNERLRMNTDVKSSFFRLTGEIQIQQARVFVNSVLFREPGGTIRVIMRQFTPDTLTTTTPPDTASDASPTPANTP